MRKFYTNANMLIRNFFKCSVDVKCYLFKTYCSTMYCSAMWFDTTKSAMEKLKVAYNNSLRRLLSLPTYNNNNNNTLFQTIVHMDNKKKIQC